MADRRFFLCSGQAVTADLLKEYPDSHIIGELRHVWDKEGDTETRVTALALYEKSLPVGAAPTELPDVRVDIIGDARRIKCTYPSCETVQNCEKIQRCENVQRWNIGKAAFLQLMSRFGKPAA